MRHRSFQARRQLQTDLFSFYEGGPRTRSEWEGAVAQLLDMGQAFYAYTLGAVGMQNFPDSIRLRQMAAPASVRTGAVERSKEISGENPKRISQARVVFFEKKC